MALPLLSLGAEQLSLGAEQCGTTRNGAEQPVSGWRLWSLTDRLRAGHVGGGHDVGVVDQARPGLIPADHHTQRRATATNGQRALSLRVYTG